MFSRNCSLLQIINGDGGALFSQTFVKYSTTTKKAQAQSGVLADYLINSLGFSKEAAISASNKVTRSKPFKKEPDSVVNFFKELGLNKTDIRSMVSSHPRLLFCSVDKTLEPKVKVLQELGLSGLDTVKVIMAHKSLLVKGLDSYIKPRIEYFRKLFGADDRVAAALRRYALKKYKIEIVKQNVSFLQNVGFTNDNIVKFIVKDPKNILFARAEKVQDILHRVENDLGIPRESAMFHYGIRVLGSFSQSNIDAKFGIFRSFGWSDADIFEMVRILPLILCISGDRMRRSLDFFMKELGYKSEYLASRPVLLSLNLERRVKPRHEVLKTLNEKKLNKRKAILYTVLLMPESKFVKFYILPYKEKLPDMYAAYIKKVGLLKIGDC